MNFHYKEYEYTGINSIRNLDVVFGLTSQLLKLTDLDTVAEALEARADGFFLETIFGWLLGDGLDAV